MTERQASKQGSNMSEEELFAVMGWTGDQSTAGEDNILRPPTAVTFSGKTWKIIYHSRPVTETNRTQTQSAQNS